MTRHLRIAAVGLASLGLVGLATGCTSSPPDAAESEAMATTTTTGVPSPVPGDEWQVVAPSEVGLDAAALDELAAEAEASGSSCLLVVRDGRIAGEWYFGGADPRSPREVFSVTKSITSVLVGIAQAEGALAIDDPASRWIEEWRGTPSEPVTIEDILSNDSGRTWTEAGNWPDLLASPDQTAYAIGLGQQDPPGTAWRYDNSAIQTLDAVLGSAVGRDVGEWADEVLFEPLGMHDTAMGRDPAGNTLTYAWATSTCRDLARFGLLALHDGDWGGQRIVPEAWVEASTAAPSTPLTPSYGYLWWLNLPEPSPTATTTATDAGRRSTPPLGQVVPGAPTDLFWAQGLGNQLVQVHPATDTVLVRLSGDGPVTATSTFGPATAARLVSEGVLGPVP